MTLTTKKQVEGEQKGTPEGEVLEERSLEEITDVETPQEEEVTEEEILATGGTTILTMTTMGVITVRLNTTEQTKTGTRRIQE